MGVNIREFVQSFIIVGMGERHHARTTLILNHHLHGLTPIPSRLCRPEGAGEVFFEKAESAKG
jgi:hypothetical protein